MIPVFNPPAPGQINLTRFQDLRTFLQQYIINRWMQSVNTFMQNDLVPTLNTQLFASPNGPNLASAATISPGTLVQRVTGSTPIATITPPTTKDVPLFYAIAQDGFSTVTSGNILTAVTVAANHMAIFAYDTVAQKWGVVTS